jgi:UDP-N-acetylglucosamine diphosphorylase/glucosamine-1-phosphate N-acetyltransferase
MNNNKAALILAAGKGKRMKSDLPKVLHEINGRPLIRHLLDTITTLKFDKIVVVVGHKGELVKEALSDLDVEYAWQNEQLGTGHAVLMARNNFRDFEGTILVAAGDVPFLSAGSIKRLFDIHLETGASVTCLSAIFDDPKGYGRVIRKPGTDLLEDIVEDKDASPEIKKINEINSGTFCFAARDLFGALEEVKNENVQKEYYLTDTVKILRKRGRNCAVALASDPLEVTGVNSVEQLARLQEKIFPKNR